MRITVPGVNRFFFLLTAPFAGMFIWLLWVQLQVQVDPIAKPSAESFTLKQQAEPISTGLDTARNSAKQISSSLKRKIQLYEQTNNEMERMLGIARKEAPRPLAIYDRKITSRLGSPFRQTSSKNVDIKLFVISEPHYSGYAMKVKLKSQKAMSMVLGKDKFGGSETTMAAVCRYGAIAGVNAGGFADQGGRRYPLSTTMLNGKYVHGFAPSTADLFFVGLSYQGELVGGKFNSQSELDQLNPKFGATFVPVLLKNKVIQTIPAKWLLSPQRAPRTIVANYKDNQLLFVVIDGRNENGSSGATLPEVQNKLVKLGVIDAYNLDGGGSSSLIFDGDIINHPSDGRLRPLATNFLFFK